MEALSIRMHSAPDLKGGSMRSHMLVLNAPSIPGLLAPIHKTILNPTFLLPWNLRLKLMMSQQFNRQRLSKECGTHLILILRAPPVPDAQLYDELPTRFLRTKTFQ